MTDLNKRVIVTCSGGQDSVCLLYLLHQLQPKWAWMLGIAHCDHAWHPSSKIQSLHVSTLASKLSIDCYQCVAVHLTTQEHTARNWRYKQFTRIAAFHCYPIATTAHTASDRVETLLHHLMRGSGADGLQSLGWKRHLNVMKSAHIIRREDQDMLHVLPIDYIQHVTSFQSTRDKWYPQLIRPLLSTTRDELNILRREWALEVWPDCTNRDISFRRNYVRHQILPYLRDHFEPRVDQALARWAELVHAEAHYLDTTAKDICQQRVKVARLHSAYLLCLDFVRVLPLALQRRVIKRFLYLLTSQSVTYYHVEEVRLMCLISSTTLKNHKGQHQPAENTLTFVLSKIALPNNAVLQFTQEILIGLRGQKEDENLSLSY